MADGEAGPQAQDDFSVLRTEDQICLSCTMSSASAPDTPAGERVCLAAEGFGNRTCFLQSMANKDLPFDISVSVFALEQALSVRALQEMVSSKSGNAPTQSGHRTLLYGHAVLLRHSHSNMYLSCLSTQSSSSDKLAFDVGLKIDSAGESCWWTIHPASKQRSEGEKVRVGDDLILVSVASERYLHIGLGELVIASFQQTLWTVQPVSSGVVKQKSLGFVFGGDVLRVLHGDECLTIPPRDSETGPNVVMYETGAVQSHARSLWKIEHVRTKWAEGFINWGLCCRLRHITSGRYLAVTDDNQVVTFHRSQATVDASSFILRQSKDDKKFLESRDDEGMGNADVKYGDSLVYAQHMKSGLWVSYQTFETKKKGVGRVEEKKAIVMVEGHMDDGLNFSRAQIEEDKSARVIRKCTSLISRFIKALDSLRHEGRSSRLWESISLAEVIKTLEDLIDYFAPPSLELDFEERQMRLKALRNRQDLFQEEGMIALILETVDCCSQWKSMRQLAHLIGEDSASKWNDMINYLYLLLAAMIQGNRANCCQFAASNRLDWLVNRLEGQESSKGVLDVFHCVLVDSPEALNVIREQHIRTIISLIDKHGRDPKVLDVLCSLCMGNDVAVRSNQNHICENLLPGCDLLLQTKIVDSTYSMYPNIFVGRLDGSSMYQFWYYEVIIDHVETVGANPPLIRVGWANTEGFIPFPGGGEMWGANGIGDDLYSYGFDGVNLWTGCLPKRVRTTQTFQKGDVIGVLLDLSIPQISFTVNGVGVKGFFKDFNLDGMFYPVISVSSKASVRFMLGRDHGKLKYGPPADYSPMCEALIPKHRLKIMSCFDFGNIPKGLVYGPNEVQEYVRFVPSPVDISHVQLPSYIGSMTDKLAANIHELWTISKIEAGWQFDEIRDDYQKCHPCLINFDKLPENERMYNMSLAEETLKTLIALGYHISYDPQYTSNNRIKYIKLSNNYLQSNGYKPSPLDCSAIHLNEKMQDLVELMAENTHNVWSQDRIQQGWTYGLNEDHYIRRSPHLLPYSKVDESIKKANRETASETIRALMTHGYSLEPPTNESGENTLTLDTMERKEEMRIFRGEKTYAQSEGKWYYEFEVLTTGYMKVGWAKVCSEPCIDLGTDGNSYVFDGYVGRKWYQGAEAYGKQWKKGDVIGCMLDIIDKTISFSLNGELMMDRLGQEIAFKGIDLDDAFVPAFSLSPGQQGKLNFGQDVNTLTFFTTCGLQEGYEPFCVNMNKPMPLWYGKVYPLFNPVGKAHSRLEVIRVPGGSSSPPCLKVHSKTYGSLEKVSLEYLRLSLPVKCQAHFISPREKMNFTSERKALAEQHHHGKKGHGHDAGGHKEKRGLFKKKNEKHRSMDDSSVDMAMPKKAHGGRMKRGSSEADLASGFLSVKDKNTEGSKFSLFTDLNKGTHEKHAKKKGPFSLFKKSRSRESSPQPGSRPITSPNKFQVSSSEYSDESESDSMMLGPELGLGTHKPKGMKKAMSDASFGSEGVESDGEVAEMEAQMAVVDEYYYGVRIFPGQDPNHIYVGWVSPGFHAHSTEFDMKKIRNVVVSQLDADYRVKSSVSRKNCYLVSAGDLQHRYGHQEDAGKRLAPGLLIGCHIDVSTGVLSFTVNGKEVANKFQVEPGALLFPAVFCEPTNKEVMQFELGKNKQPFAMPLSSILFRGGKHIQPQCPPRLDLQILETDIWSRVPVTSSKVHTLKLSDIRGWSMLCEEPVTMMSLHIPDENRSVDILELIEHPDLLKFHAQTLHLYQATVFNGNHRVAHELTKHVDMKQMVYVITSKYMPGPLRMGFHDLLIALHLKDHTNAKFTTQKEFIIPLELNGGDEFHLFRECAHDDPTFKVRETIPVLKDSVSIRPNTVDEAERIRAEGNPLLTVPPFPLDFLKFQMMMLLKQAVANGAHHIRDPIGGSNAELFVPLIRTLDNLLIIGLLDDRDLYDLLCLINPLCFDIEYNNELIEASPDHNVMEALALVSERKNGLLQMKLSEPVKRELCKLLQTLCDCQLRHRVESIINFASGFVDKCQSDQLQRYKEIRQEIDMPPALTARKTREFRCPPQEQMRITMAFRKTDFEEQEEDPSKMVSSCSDNIIVAFKDFHSELLRHCGHPGPIEEAEDEENMETEVEVAEPSWARKLLSLIISKDEQSEDDGKSDERPDSLQKLIIETVITWAKSDYIQDQELVREMFSLLHRQYDGVGELIRSLDKAYVISSRNKEDINKLLRALSNVRGLLKVQVCSDEEEILKTSIWDLADNKVFFQHPDLIRSLGIHETVMQLMVNTLNKAKQGPQASSGGDSGKRRSSISSTTPGSESEPASAMDSAADMVVACCRFLCYFCRTGSVNQSAMFEHLSYLLDNSCMLLSRPSLRGSCPLDVAYSSLMDNNELALALRESDLDKVTVYLSRCGQQSNQELLTKGYPDIGWDPVDGERFLDFLRFCVWVNGDSVEENANLVVRLLIRRPECLGPALRGEGGGLLKATKDGIMMSEQIAAARDADTMRFLMAVTAEEDDDRGNYLHQTKFNFNSLPPDDDEDYIDMGAARLNFYASLVELLGRCAPDAEIIKAGRSDSIRARAILRSLVSIEDLEGVLGLRFILPVQKLSEQEDGEAAPSSMPPGLLPIHKAAIVLFLERVYGIEDQLALFRLLEEGFLPDLRAATVMDSVAASDNDMALALNRYVCTSVLPLLTTYCHFFQDADHATAILDQTLHTVYKLSKCKSLTKNQRDTVSDFLVAYTSELRPPMMTSLLRKLVIDVPALTENTLVPLRLLNNHYERCGAYYGSGGYGGHGTANEEERRLTMMLFSGIFDSLAERAYDPELFSKALPCLSAIACALSPDYSLSNQEENWYQKLSVQFETDYNPDPADTSKIRLNDQLTSIAKEFADHYHDARSLSRIEAGWICGSLYDDESKTHPNLKMFRQLPEKTQKFFLAPVYDQLKAMIAWGWNVEMDNTRAVSRSQIKRKMSQKSLGDYSPRPVDLRNVTLTREMLTLAERLAENSHAVWAKHKRAELESVGGGMHPQMVPYEILTEREKKKDRDRALELLRFLQMHGFRVHGGNDLRGHGQREPSRHSKDSGADSGVGVSSTEKRFAYRLLEKLLEYLDKAAWNMKITKPATRYSRRHSYSISSEDVKFFGKVVLPLVERYFHAHKPYFISNPNIPPSSGTASIKEKEMTASLFSKLALLLRQRIMAFGHDTQISVRCLQTLVQAIDARAVVKNSPEIVRSSLLPFLSHAADDLTQIVQNLKVGRFSHVKGTITRGATSLNYVHMVLVPVLSSMFSHLGRYSFGADVLVGEQQLCCYRIFKALYALGTHSSEFVQRDSIMEELSRHRPDLGECVASFASTFPVAFLEPDKNIFNVNSILYGIAEENIAAHSLEAKEVMDEVAETVPGLDKIVAEIEGLALSGGNYTEAPHVIEVTLPMLCSYLPFWWSQGPDNMKENSDGKVCTAVTAELMNGVLGNVLKLIRNNIGTLEAPWMTTIATRTQPIIANATAEMLKDHLLPVADKLSQNAKDISHEEDLYTQERRLKAVFGDNEENVVQERFQTLVRDMYAYYPLLIKYVDLHRSYWLKNPNPECEKLYLCVADVFNIWTKSHVLKKEEQNFVSANEIDNMKLIMPSQDQHSDQHVAPDVSEGKSERKGRNKRTKSRMESCNSLNVACLKRLLPIGLNMFGGQEQELVQQAKQKLIQDDCKHKEIDGDIEDFLIASFQAEDNIDEDDAYKWQKTLYKKIGSKQEQKGQSMEKSVQKVLAMAKVLQGLHLVEHPPASMKMTWKKVVSSQRKRAVMACFRMIPLHSLPLHRAINLFVKCYKRQWLDKEEPGTITLIEDVTGGAEEEEDLGGGAGGEEQEDVADLGPQPLGQLITAFSRAATTQIPELLESDFLYISYANIMSQSCHGEEDEDEGGDGEAATLQEQEMEKQMLLSEQARLSDRGAAEMALMYISASRGNWSDMVIGTIDLGISVLLGGNVDVQKRMLDHLREKKEVGFFTSVAGLMQQCSVLDLDAFERCNKAEGLGMNPEGGAQVKNLHDADLTIKLFRFLQLLCEGHNLDFQNYIRTQAGNTTTVNLVICTVDFLLRIQESMMDFYWHYSGKSVIDCAGVDSFIRAIHVAAQVFCSITEYIQGPCVGNQLALAHSRLWDAVGGFLFIFAHMQDKLSKDPDQIDLLREFMGLQKEMMIMMLSMLEGNVMNGPIGKQMVDTLVESSQNFEMILKFFDIFLKMKDLSTSEAFAEFDVNHDGSVSRKEFKRAMEMQKVFTIEEIEYVMMCVDANQDGFIDFDEFTERFYGPVKEIGFNVAVLLTNLSEHMPDDPRLERFLEKAGNVLEYFEPYLGRIEITGMNGRIERVYFEITQSNIDQWEKPQIKESKRTFLHNIVNEGGEGGKLVTFVDFCEDTIFEDSKRAFLHNVVNEDGEKEKLESFTSFCEDTIFEMQHATSISSGDNTFGLMDLFRGPPQEGVPQSGGIWETTKTGLSYLKDGFFFLLSCLSPSNIRDKWTIMRSMTIKQLIMAFFRFNMHVAMTILTILWAVLRTFVRFIIALMTGDKSEQMARRASIIDGGPLIKPIKPIIKHMDDANGVLPGDDKKMSDDSNADRTKSDHTEDGQATEFPGQTQTEAPVKPSKSMLNGTVPSGGGIPPASPVFEDNMGGENAEDSQAEPEPEHKQPKLASLSMFVMGILARNFYNFKLLALALAFFINMILLFFKVTTETDDLMAAFSSDGGGDGDDPGDDEEEPLEWVNLDEDLSYLGPFLRTLAIVHTLLSFSIMVAYYVLKVPLVIFKREKEISRSLEFDGMWISEQPSEDDIRGHWDKLAISTNSFPDKYWDKFVKKKVKNKYSEQYEPEQINALLGIDAENSYQELASSILPSFLTEIDFQYQAWKWGIIFTDNSFLYICWCLMMSVLGNFNYFFFAAHLLDIATCFKSLGTILQSVTHNGKQLVLTVMLLSVIVYVYTVVAFNFFRKFYNKGEDGEDDYKCHDMLTCFVFHLYVGVRAGGGIGDEIDAPDGDPNEVFRILFDITFFFFIIIILLAIIQGLIIDAFGELRDQLEQVKEDLESACFICGVGKDYFDKVPHGFETHVTKEHNFANYMFFLMHLINKPDTEYTGQESYVWELYQQRSWDFFPVGNCFMKQYDNEDSGS